MGDNFIKDELLKYAEKMNEQGQPAGEILENLEKISPDVYQKTSEEFLRALKNNATDSIRQHDLYNKGFLSRLEFRWYKAFDLLDILVNVSLEIVQEIYIEYNASNREEAYLNESFFRLHARAICIAKEIEALIKNGFADGAMARWRSLFEICSIVLFLDKHGEDTAEKYIKYQDVERYDEMIEYQKRYIQLGLDELPNSEIEALTRKKEELEKEYSNAYSKNYGWTYCILSEKRNMAGIIEDIDFELWKPYYKMACSSVHSGPKALYYKLSVFGNRDMLLVGPTNSGFADPAQNTAISIVQITSVIIKRKPNDTRILVMNALLSLSQEIGEIFNEIQGQIEQEENKFHPSSIGTTP